MGGLGILVRLEEVLLSLEALNVGGWLTHGDTGLETTADFLAVSEHRLIPARVRSEWAGLRRKGIHSVWAPASQDGSHVGHAGVGVVSLKGAPISMPSFATSAFRQFFDLGRLVRCVLPLGHGRVMHLVVVYGYQGAEDDAEKLSLTDQLFDAALSELAVISRGQPCVLAGDFNIEPTKIPCLLKGIMHGLRFDLQGAWSIASGVDAGVTCKKDWASSGGTRRDFILGCPLATAALGSCWVDNSRWIQPHFAVVAGFQGGSVGRRRLPSLAESPLFGLLLGFRQLINLGIPGLLRFGIFGTYMTMFYSLSLVMTLVV